MTCHFVHTQRQKRQKRDEATIKAAFLADDDEKMKEMLGDLI